jgi:carbon-monoxide dehydrogenase large subunit
MKFGIGQSVKRKEDVRLVTGQGHFTDDLKLTNEAHAHFIRSPHPHAVIRSVDVEAVRAVPGIIGVLTAEDLGDTGPMPVRGMFKNRDGSTIKQTPKALLPKDKVRFAGEAVGLVVAETAAIAKDAAELAAIDYEALAASVSLDTAPTGAQIWHDMPGNLAFDWGEGNEAECNAAFTAAARTVAVELVQNRIAANPMEPRGAIGVYDASNDQYTLYTSTQGPSTIRDRIAAALLKIPPEKLRVISQDVGGGFGMKATVVAEQALVLIAAKRFGRPVRWTGERIEAFLADGHGRDVKMRGELALDKDARILGLRLESAADMGAYMTHVAPYIPTVGLRVMGGVYRIPAVYAHVQGYVTNTTAVTSYRGAGRPEAIYITERLLDAAAAAFGIDRLEIRRRNLIAPYELPYRNWRGLSIDSGDFPGNLELCAQRAEWAGFEARRADTERRGKRRGLGVAYYFEASGGPGGAEPAVIRFADNGAIEVYLATQSNGQGHETAFAQIVSDRLGVPFDSVIIKQGDTDFGVAGGGTVGSRSAQASGNAISVVVESVVRKGKAAAAQVLQAGGAPVDFEIQDGIGRFRVSGTTRSIGVSDLATTLKRERLPGFESGLDDAATFDSPPTFPNGCHICEVELDPETGAVEIVAYHIVDDVGRVINPMILDGQIHGGVAQGLGQALMENVIYDEKSGQLMTATFVDYALPRAEDMPALDIVYNEIPCTTNPLGVKGAGEAGTIGSLPAIIGAISDALRVLHIDMPATPEKLWRAAREHARV